MGDRAEHDFENGTKAPGPTTPQGPRGGRAMARMTGGEALVKQLVREGVRVVFGLPGVQIYGTLAALRDEPGVRLITTRHEQATSYMADGYARAGGDIGTALVVPGPRPPQPAAGPRTPPPAPPPPPTI